MIAARDFFRINRSKNPALANPGRWWPQLVADTNQRIEVALYQGTTSVVPIKPTK
jgi:hypothetical protein